MSHVFISYKREDLGRVTPLVEALRARGIPVWWDQDIPPGGAWRETIVEKLDGAALCVAIWSETSVGPAGRFVREEAERLARRGAYLGVLVDPVPPPFGFAEWQAIDMAGWRGDPADPLLTQLVDRVAARLDGAEALAPPRPLPAAPPVARRRTKLPVMLGVAAAIAVAGAAIAWFVPWRGSPPTPTAFVSDKLAQADCTWAGIGEVSTLPDGEHISLKGIASSPEAIQASLMRDAAAASVPLTGVQVHDLAAAPPQVCGELQLMKPFRAPPNERRLTIIPPRATPGQAEAGLTFFEFELNIADMPRHAALLGLDDKSGLKVVLPDLPGFLRSTPPRRQSGNVITHMGGMDDEGGTVRNVGLVLMTSREPIDQAFVEKIGTDISADFLQRLDQVAKAGNWQFELALVRCGFEGGDRRC